MKKAIFVLLALLPSLLFAQLPPDRQANLEQEIASLKEQVDMDDLKVSDLKIVTEIRRAVNYLNLDTALYYTSIEIELASKTKDPNLLANAKIARAMMLWKLQQPDPAYKLLLENLENSSVLTDTTLAQTLFRLSKVELQKQMPSESIEHVIQASKIYEKLKDSSYSSECFSHIAGMYTFVLDENEKALQYYEKALKYNGPTKRQNAVRIYINYSSAFLGLSEFDKAIVCVRKAEDLAKESNNLAFLPSIYAQFAHIYYEDKNYQESLRYAEMGNSLIQQTPTFDRMSRDKIYWYMALANKELMNYQEALNYFESIKMSPYLDPWDIQSNLIEIYKETGRFEQAFLMQEKLIAAKDSIDELERFGKIKEVTERYENEKKQQEIITLNAEKKLQKSEIRTQQFLLYGTIAFFLVLIVIGAFWYRTRAKLRETRLNLESAELQQRFLRTQLNPHFFFHALTSIEGYIYKNDKLESARFLRNFSVLMRNILEFSDVDLITLSQDIDFIKKYIELQQLNHEFKFNYEIEISPELNPDDIKIPPMLIQPAVENAILHGALKNENGLISIEYSKVDDQFQISIKDNGEKNQEAQPSANRLNRSMSLDITQTRINNFQEVHGVTISYNPYDSINNSADSSVMFRMPLKM